MINCFTNYIIDKSLYRYERGRRRRTSDVYRDKLLEFTMSAGNKTKVRHTSAAPKLALPIQDEESTNFEKDEKNCEMTCMKIAKDYHLVLPAFQSSITDMNNIKLATIVTSNNSDRGFNFDTRRVSV